MAKRVFWTPPYEDRCQWHVRLKDDTTCDCMRRRTVGVYCTQHAKMVSEGKQPKPSKKT